MRHVTAGARADIRDPHVASHMQIGEVAERVGLSLRTIRYYEEAGLVTPSDRSPGGFRLYTEADCERLRLVRRMKPLGFTLEEMCELLAVLEQADPMDGEPVDDVILERLDRFTRVAEERCARLRGQLSDSVSFTDMLKKRLARHEVEGDT